MHHAERGQGIQAAADGGARNLRFLAELRDSQPLALGSKGVENLQPARHLTPLLKGQPADNLNALTQRLNSAIKGNTFAKSAIETALLDAQGKALGLPVSALLGGALQASLPVLWTLASGDTHKDIAEGERLLAEGRHQAFKLKIGASELASDLRHTRAIVEAIGSEADIARLVADSLGLELNVVPTSWEDWPLGVASGKYDAAISNITVTKERKEKFDFATYRKDSLGFYVKSTSPLNKIDKAEDIAGLKIIVGSGTNQEAILLAWNAENVKRGLKPFIPVYTKDDAAQTLALQTGRADAYFGPNVIGAWKAALTGKTKLVGSVDGGWPKAAHIAVTLKKGSGLVNAVQAALNGAIASGDYAKVLNRWGEGVESIPQSEINPAGLGD